MRVKQFIILNSATASRQNESQKPEDFTTEFTPPLDLTMLKNKVLKVALINFNGTYSWYNVSDEYKNNVIRYSFDGNGPFEIKFLPGIYDYKDLNSEIFVQMKQNGHISDVKQSRPIILDFNVQYYRVQMYVQPKYSLDLTLSEFNELIGFEKTILRGETRAAYRVHTGTKTPNINHSLDRLYIHCNLTSSSIVDGVSDDTIFTFPTANLSPSNPFVFEPRHLKYSDLSTYYINNIRIYITDVYGNPVALNSVPVTVELMIKEFKD